MIKKMKMLLAVGTMSASLFSFSNTSSALTLKIAHNLAKNHPTSKALIFFANKVKKDSHNKIKLKIFFNGVLGSERETVEQLQSGSLDMLRIGAATLSSFDDTFTAFTLPYLFKNKKDFYKVMHSKVAEKIYMQSKPSGFIGLTFLSGGVRSFYTKNTPIMKPSDLKGLKIRVMNSHTQIKMLQLMGGSPTPLAYGEVYTSLQQGVIDGGENNPTALTLGRHGEVAKAYSFDYHGFIPDFIIISNKTWNKLNTKQRKIIKNAALAATEYHTKIWEDKVKTAIEEAKTKLGVKFYYPDTKPFQKAVAPLYEEYMKNPKIAKIVNEIRK